LVVAGAPETLDDAGADIDGTLRILLDELPLKQAVALAVKLTGGSRNVLYERALALKGGS
jgi:16S rRNA (cytidine1402-2'-O)-methyltransferase